jgi:cytochrome c6
MKDIFALVITITVVSVFAVFIVPAAATSFSGAEAFMKHCAVCHPNGGNIINTAKPLNKTSMAANGIKTPADIVKNMRNPGPAMTRFDKKTIDDKTAKAIADYILKTFK